MQTQNPQCTRAGRPVYFTLCFRRKVYFSTAAQNVFKHADSIVMKILKPLKFQKPLLYAYVKLFYQFKTDIHHLK